MSTEHTAFPASRSATTSIGYYEHFAEATHAIRREKQIKDYARAKKLAMIGSLNPGWIDLSEGWFLDGQKSDSSLRSE